MKKINIFIAILCVCSSFLFSCKQELDIWNSATLNYSGRYVIKLMNEDMSTVLADYDGSEFYLYNTAENVANMLWIEDMKHLLPLKSKFTLSGDPASFKSTTVDFDKLTNNIFAINEPTSKEAKKPTAEGQTVVVSRECFRAAVLDGKIMPQAATTLGGNKADSLFLKIKLYGGSATFKSYLLPKEKWAKPNEKEFAWKFESVTYDKTKDEIRVVAGHRYTGFEEDRY